MKKFTIIVNWRSYKVSEKDHDYLLKAQLGNETERIAFSHYIKKKYRPITNIRNGKSIRQFIKKQQRRRARRKL